MVNKLKKPIIIITSGVTNAAPPYDSEKEWNIHCPLLYIRAVEKAGGIPLVLPPMTDLDTIDDVINTAHGILLSGGGDISPLSYNEEPHPKLSCVDSVRDNTEIAVVKSGIKNELPILGVCRGMQLLNVALGGTLLQDIPTQHPNAIQHVGGSTLLPSPSHNIDIEKNSLLSLVLGSDKIAVNSFHHQSVNLLGNRLKINSRTADGIIEGIESNENKPILGVQFHPEELVTEYQIFLNLFKWLVSGATDHI